MVDFSSDWFKYLNYTLIAIIVGQVIYRTFFAATTSKKTVGTEGTSENSKPVYEEFTPRSLSVYDGTGNNPTNDTRVLMAVKGLVFDVSLGRSFYGPDGPYHNFAGRDASRGLATNSFDDDMISDINGPIDTLEGLTEEEQNTLDEWFSFFKSKYTEVGKLVENEDLKK